MQENDGATGISRAAVAHGKSHTVRRRHPNGFLAPAVLDVAVMSWPTLFEVSRPAMQSSGCAVRERPAQHTLASLYSDSHAIARRRAIDALVSATS